MNLTPVGQAIYSLIRADRASAGPMTIEERCAALEQALRDLIRKELVINNVLAERNPMD